MSKITLCIDPGASQTKVVYQLPKEKKPRYLLMFPEVEQVSVEKLNRHLDIQSNMSNPAPERQAYLKLKERTVIVGHFAQNFAPEDRINEIKYENALYKVMAVIGVITQRNDLNSKKLSLKLSILLPWNEYADRGKFLQKLKEYLKEFEFRGQSFSVELEYFGCRPEGGGIASLVMQAEDKNSDWQQNHKMGILMFGHRNITALNFQYGELTGDSPLIGFSKLLDNVVKRTSGQTRERIASAIFKGLASMEKEYELERDAKYSKYPNWSELESTISLANAKDSDLRAQEIEEMEKAILISTEQYWEDIVKWLDKIFPEPLDLVVISGGASVFLAPDIEKYFNCCHLVEIDAENPFRQKYLRTGGYESADESKAFTPILWGAGWTKSIEEIFNMDRMREPQESLSSRIMDAYGMFENLKDKKGKKFSSKGLVGSA